MLRDAGSGHLSQAAALLACPLCCCGGSGPPACMATATTGWRCMCAHCRPWPLACSQGLLRALWVPCPLAPKWGCTLLPVHNTVYSINATMRTWLTAQHCWLEAPPLLAPATALSHTPLPALPPCPPPATTPTHVVRPTQWDTTAEATHLPYSRHYCTRAGRVHTNTHTAPRPPTHHPARCR